MNDLNTEFENLYVSCDEMLLRYHDKAEALQAEAARIGEGFVNAPVGAVESARRVKTHQATEAAERAEVWHRRGEAAKVGVLLIGKDVDQEWSKLTNHFRLAASQAGRLRYDPGVQE